MPCRNEKPEFEKRLKVGFQFRVHGGNIVNLIGQNFRLEIFDFSDQEV